MGDGMGKVWDEVRSVPLMLFYGQSWLTSNSNNGRVLHQNPFPDHALMLDGGRNALVTRERGAITEGFGGFVPAIDADERVQSVVTPFLYRYAADALRDGRPALCVGHSGAVSGARIERLMPGYDPRVEDATAFDNLMLAVRAHVDASAAMGKAAHVPYLIFCQGAANRTMPKEEYAAFLSDLMDILQSEIMALTAQAEPPHVLVIQPPGKGNGGAWPCLQAQVELCGKRKDMTLSVTGWAIEQHDRIHFSGEGAVGVGELCAIVARGIETGEDCSAPWIRAARRRCAQRIELEIAAPGEMVIDVSLESPRHRVAGAPVPFYGFEAESAIEEVAVEKKSLVLKFAAAPAKHLAYAYHAGNDYLECRKQKANQSANRGNLRLEKGWKSMFLNRTLHHWLASGHVRIGA